MNYESILVSKEDNIVVITINRPKALNSLNKEVLADLDHFFSNTDISSLDGVVITGAGEKAFVAGADIKEFTSLDRKKAESMTRRVHDIFNKIERFGKPVIAAVNGFALGGGCELAMACHMRIAGSKARFGQPEVNLGILPGYGGTQRLTQLVGKGKSMELTLTTDMVGAEEAHSLGLANHVVKEGKEVTKAIEIVKKIATKAPLAVKEVIHTINSCFDKNVDGFEEEIKAFGRLASSNDFKEGASAFIEKRKANWKGE